MSAALWPYLVVVLAGFVPNEMFRLGAVLLSRGVDERSELFSWIRIVAVALLAAVVSKLLYQPPAALALVPLWLRIMSVAVGIGAYFWGRRALAFGILAGECALVATSWWLGLR